MRRIMGAGAALAVLGWMSAQAQEAAKPQTVSAHVTVSSSKSGRTTAVLGRDGEKGEPQFLFCISHDPLSSPPAVKGPAKVTYVPRPTSGLPPGVKVSGPERVANVLGIAPESGTPVVFAGKGQTLDDPALQKATVVPVSSVRRVDWSTGSGPRRGISVEGCLSPGG